MTLSYNQWSTILKTKQINEALLYKQNDSVDIEEDFDGGRIIDNESESNRNKFFGNLAVISVKDTTTNIQILMMLHHYLHHLQLKNVVKTTVLES